MAGEQVTCIRQCYIGERLYHEGDTEDPANIEEKYHCRFKGFPEKVEEPEREEVKSEDEEDFLDL
jgi:hypothetical protein